MVLFRALMNAKAVIVPRVVNAVTKGAMDRVKNVTQGELHAGLGGIQFEHVFLSEQPGSCQQRDQQD
jgi:hypothetical protein